MEPERTINTRDWPYQTANTVVLPYKESETWFYPEDMLVTLYYRLKKQDLLATMFPGMPDPHLNKFIRFVGSPGHPMVCCMTVENEAVQDVAGFGFIEEVDGVDGARKATAGYGFFKEYWGTQTVRDLGWSMLAYWFKEFKIDVIMGMGLKTNRLNQNFLIKTYGFEVLGVVPHFFYGNGRLNAATMVQLEREPFLSRYEAWRVSVKVEEVTAMVGG